MKQPTAIISYRDLYRLLRNAAYWCDKACGCEECDLHELERFAFDDLGVYEIER